MRASSGLLVLVLAACESNGGSAQRDASAPDAQDKAAACADTFGNELTDAFGRLDGTVLAVVPPAMERCAQPNSTHLVVQATMHGAAYRLVVNVENIFMYELDAPLAGPAWSDGWHTDAPLDYVTNLCARSSSFELAPDAVQRVTDMISLGEKISIYSTSSGGTKADSAHLVHRNAANADGAIVLGPDTATPHYLLFRFSNQLF